MLGSGGRVRIGVRGCVLRGGETTARGVLLVVVVVGRLLVVGLFLGRPLEKSRLTVSWRHFVKSSERWFNRFFAGLIKIWDFSALNDVPYKKWYLRRTKTTKTMRVLVIL